MESTVERLVGETRRRILSLLRREERSVADLAAALGVTSNAARTHVAALERDGLVARSGVRRETGGKPARLYGLTTLGEELFPKVYAPVLGAVLDELERREGRRAVVDLLRSVGAKLASGAAGASSSDVASDEPSGAEASRVERAAEVLRSLGGAVDVERTSTGWRLCGHGCPLSAVVPDHEELCALVESLVATVVDRPVRERCDRSGRPRCAFDVAASSGSAGPSPAPSG